MEELARQVGSLVLALLLTYLRRFVQPRSRVVHWFPAAFQFQLPIPNAQPATVWTHALSIQNTGQRAARGVEIIHQQKPQHFQIKPAVKFTTSENPTGEHVISIDSLAPREWITIQILSAGTQPPNLVNVKSADGQSRQKQTTRIFVASKANQRVVATFFVIGLATVIYLILNLAIRYGPLLWNRPA